MTKRRYGDEWNGLFHSFDDEFEVMREQMDRLMESALNGIGTDPFIYGLSMRRGADGRPIVQMLGDLPQIEHHSSDTGQREPLIDIIEEEARIKVIIELPGVDREDLDLRSEGRDLNISVDTEMRKFSKRIDLPCDVMSDSATAEYNNGVLTVMIDKLPQSDQGHRIAIN
ncbi:MAG: Hsp20/alpha crystallin family protein [Methanomassiliicoccales archaeon]|nr:Hsp20/alpha crystallin family protein [Methanomassiliicoccales archaeon]